MHEPDSPDHRRVAPVRRLVVLPDLSGESEVPERFPIHRDPLFQLGALGVVFVITLASSLATSGILSAALEIAVTAAAVLICAVFLRSVRTGWNVKAYGRARRALQREATLRLERDVLRRSYLELGASLAERREDGAWGGLGSLVRGLHQVLGREVGSGAVAVVEETAETYRVLAVAGSICARPSYVAPGKSCAADRPFGDVLGSFAPRGSTAARRIDRDGRSYWVGALCADPSSGFEKDLVAMLAAWVQVAAATGPPVEVEPILRVS
jgi:hypothetical protein